MDNEYKEMTLRDAADLREKFAKQQKERKRKNFGFFIGFLVVVFSLIGFAGCIFAGVNFITQKNEEKSRSEFSSYETFFIPVAAVDPTTFDDVSSAKSEELIEIAVWSIIGSDLEPEKYVYTDKELIIPAGEIEAAFIKYFGTSVIISHKSVTGYGYEFSYNSDENAYYIPLTAIEPLYTPVVTDREVKGDTEIITVGLINTSAWKQDSKTGDISRPDPDKYLKITLLNTDSGMHIRAIRTTSLPETAFAG